MTVISLNNEISFSIASAYEQGGAGSLWILSTGFWVDNSIWLDEQVWNDGV